MNSKKHLLSLLLIFSFLLFLSCAHKKDVKKVSQITIEKPAKVFIPPFTKVTERIKKNFKCEIADKSIVCNYSDEQFKLIGRQLATKFYFALQKRDDYKPVSIDSVENVFQKSIDKISINEIVEKFKIHYIIEGFVYKFIERKGSDYSVEEPATIHFVIALRNAITGEIVWQKEYYEKQQELSKNLLNIFNFFKRKGKWLTALELAEQSIYKIVDELP